MYDSDEDGCVLPCVYEVSWGIGNNSIIRRSWKEYKKKRQRLRIVCVLFSPLHVRATSKLNEDFENDLGSPQGQDRDTVLRTAFGTL